MRRRCFGLLLFLLGLAGAGLARATDRTVPDPFLTIQSAVDSAQVGEDRVVITQGGIYDPFLLNKEITVTKGDTVTQVVTISGSGHYYAARISYDAGTDARIEGLTLTGGSQEILLAENGTVNNCVIDAQGTAYPYGAVRIGNAANYTTAHITNCTLDLSVEDGYGMFVVYAGQYAGDVVITGNTITANGGTGNAGCAIYVDEGPSDIEDNSIEFSGDKIAYGILTPSGYTPTIAQNTIRNALQGIYVDSYGLYDNATISYNLLVDCTRGINLGRGTADHNTVALTQADNCQGVETEGIHSVYGTLSNNLMVNMGLGLYCAGGTSLSHNIFWSDDPCGDADNCSSDTSEVKVLEPVFCASREGSGEYTQRIDSAASPGNNGWSQLVGAYDVECAWGSLDRSSTVRQGSTVTGLEDVTVPSGKTLTFQSGVAFKLDDDDNSSGGDDTAENELIVSGTLDVNGTGGSLVTFTSAKATPAEGDWTGIVVKTGGSADIDHAVVEYAEEGVRGVYNADQTVVTNSTFRYNETDDMNIAGDNSATVTVSGNTVTVGGGIGISTSAQKATVSGNSVTGNGDSVYGIEFGAQTSNQLVSGNTVEGLTTGDALYVAGTANTTPHVRSNTFRNSKRGIEVTTSKVNIGYQDSTSYKNTITGNSGSGILAIGSNAKPTIRSNDISSNFNGVTAQGGSDPDIGKSNAHGNNKLLSNSSYCIWNRNTSGTVSAQGNYFGSCNPVPLQCWAGNVDVNNYLCTAPFSIGADVAIGELPAGGLRLGVRPNPMRRVAGIRFSLAEPTNGLRVQIFDLSGRMVRDLGQRDLPAGPQEVAWDGRDSRGLLVNGGIYFVRVARPGNGSEGTKVLVVR